MANTGTRSYSAVVAAGGTAVVQIRTPGIVRWNVSQASVEMSTAPVGATCSLRLNGYLITPLVPTGDAAAGDPPILLLPSDLMTIEWASCTPGDLGKVIIIYDEVPWE